MNTIERIFKFIEYIGVSTNEFSKKLGVSNGYFAKQRASNANIGSQIIEKIVNNYPELSTDWLIAGKGGMLRGEETPARLPEPIKSPTVESTNFIDRITQLAKQVGILETKNRYQEEQIDELSETNSELEHKNEELSIRSNSMEIENETLKNLIGELQEKLELYEFPKT